MYHAFRHSKLYLNKNRVKQLEANWYLFVNFNTLFDNCRGEGGGLLRQKDILIITSEQNTARN